MGHRSLCSCKEINVVDNQDQKTEDTVQLTLIMLQSKHQINQTYKSREIFEKIHWQTRIKFNTQWPEAGGIKNLILCYTCIRTISWFPLWYSLLPSHIHLVGSHPQKCFHTLNQPKPNIGTQEFSNFTKQ